MLVFAHSVLAEEGVDDQDYQFIDGVAKQFDSLLKQQSGKPVDAWLLQSDNPEAAKAHEEGLKYGEQLRKETNEAVAKETGIKGFSNVPASNREAVFGQGGIKTLVFFSFSMPEGVASALLKQGNERDDVIFVLRGWEKEKGIAKIAAKIARVFPEQKDLKKLNIIVDPMLYRTYGVTEVPQFISKRQDDGLWYRIKGDVSISIAEHYVDSGQGGKHRPPYGNLWKIGEPDMLEVIQQRIEETDWEKISGEAWKRAQKKAIGEDLPHTTKDSTYWVDPSITVQEDIRLEDGRLVAAKGTVVNPLDNAPTKETYIIFDGESKSQILQAKAWLEEYKKKSDVVLMATRFKPLEQDNPSHIWKQLNQMVFPLSKIIVDRLQIKATPALVVQDGKYLKVFNKYLPLGE